MFAEPTDDEDGIFCSIKDDGIGFDPSDEHPGQGVGGSIRARIADQGGTVEIDSGNKRGTEVRLWIQ